MAGGVLNLISNGNDNVILYGNPSKTFFKASYKQITNFGKQKFRIDYNGSTSLNYDSETTYDFKVPRYGDLLGDTYMSFELPDIWSPFWYDSTEGKKNVLNNSNYVPFEFKWIENIGAHLIKDVTISIGGSIIGRYDGEYFYMLNVRDDGGNKNRMWNKMTGNVPEVNNPEAVNDGNYPNAFKPEDVITNIEPSIRGRKLYIPLKFWFTHAAKCAFPLVALQYVEMNIKITLRPIRELFMIRDVKDRVYRYPYVAPKNSEPSHQMFRFLQPPPEQKINDGVNYPNTVNQWNPNMHLISTYYFLTNDERTLIAKNSQRYILNDVYIKEYENVTGSQSVNVESIGLISRYNFRFQRDDTYERNTWNNFTNYPYGLPPVTGYEASDILNELVDPSDLPGSNDFFNGEYSIEKEENIMIDMGIVLDGKYRENTQPQGVYQYIEPYMSSKGNAQSGYYFYNFGLQSDYNEYQPSGGMNLTNFKNITFEINTLQPPAAENPDLGTNICDPNGNIIGIRKNHFKLNEFNYNLKVYEERVNMIIFENGIASLMFAR